MSLETFEVPTSKRARIHPKINLDKISKHNDPLSIRETISLVHSNKIETSRKYNILSNGLSSLQYHTNREHLYTSKNNINKDNIMHERIFNEENDKRKMLLKLVNGLNNDLETIRLQLKNNQISFDEAGMNLYLYIIIL